uniref:CUB domain-containing protein n=1 Tax=Macrostomum lignano TaxID=282301 RepID=A0A1I8JLC6_9PLAT
EASVVSDKQKSYRFFHSKGKSQADGTSPGFTASSPNSASNATFSATVSALVFVLTALICGVALLKLKLKSRQLQSSSPEAKLSNVPDNPAGVAKAVRKTEPTLRPRVTARSCEPECSYLSVNPNAEPADNSDRNSDTASDCTVYLEIFPIRRSRVLSTWQSSFGDGPTCFYNRNQSAEEAVLNSKIISHRFFHSADKSSADGGFHWFAVQLNEPLLIKSVTVKGRE